MGRFVRRWMAACLALGDGDAPLRELVDHGGWAAISGGVVSEEVDEDAQCGGGLSVGACFPVGGDEAFQRGRLVGVVVGVVGHGQGVVEEGDLLVRGASPGAQQV